MEIENQILAYEKKLSQMQSDLRELEKGIADLHGQIALLKGNALNADPGATVLPEAQSVQQKKAEQPVMQQPAMQPAIQQTPQQMPQQATQQVSQAAQPEQVRPFRPQKPARDFEKTFGKSFMAIFASVLIFISIVMFAMLIVPNLTNAAKMIVMYVFSIGLTAVSIYKLMKDNRSKLWVSLAGCGMGALYISFFLTNIYFKAIGDIPLYVLIFVWSVAICYLSRYQSYVFQIIGQIGVSMSILLGIVGVEGDKTKYLMITIFYVITQAVFYFTHKKDRYSMNMVSHISILIDAMMFFVAGLFMEYWISNLIVVVAIMLYTLYNMIWADRDKDFAFVPIYWVTLILLACHEWEIHFICKMQDKSLYFTGYSAFLIGVLLLMQLHQKNREAKDRPTIQLASIGMLTVTSVWFGHGYGVVAVIAVLCLLVALFLQEKVYGYCGYLAAIVAIWVGIVDEKMTVFMCIMTVVCLLIELAIIYLTGRIVGAKTDENENIAEFEDTTGSVGIRDRSRAKRAWVITVYLFVIAVVVNLLPIYRNSDQAALCYIVIGILHFLFSKTRFAKDAQTGETDFSYDIFMERINSIMVLVTLPILLSNTHLLIGVIAVAVAVYSNNVRRLLEHKQFAVNIYVGIRYTVLVITMLKALDVVGIGVSIACLLVAICSIVAGFKIHKKALRIYGLILANICVIKLVLLDMDYENAVGRALGFFVCGVLCFTISFIYSKLEKNVIMEEE